jgi:hypothetical protein
MHPGRCAGCGVVNTSCKKIRAHVCECPDYLRLYRESPEKALEPEAEYLRWKADDTVADVRAQQKDLRLQARFKALDEKRALQVERFAAPPDPLDD